MSGWRFLHWPALFVLCAVPLVILGYALYFLARRRVLARLGDGPLVQRLTANVSVGRKKLRAAMAVTALVLVIGAVARPQAPIPKTTPTRGLDIVVALDFSKSMLAKDVFPSRLERAKRELEQLLKTLAGDRVGFVAFAGETIPYPPTTDYAALELFWQDLSPWDMPVGGTALGRAMRAAQDLLVELRAKEQGATPAQVILLLTDGEDTESEPLDQATELSKLGIRVYTVGIGSRSGELIPEFDEHGQITGYMKDKDGKYVTSRLGEDMLAAIASKTGGAYLHAEARQFGTDEIKAALAGLKRTENEKHKIVDYDELFEALLLPAFLLLVGEACMSDRRQAGKASA